MEKHKLTEIVITAVVATVLKMALEYLLKNPPRSGLLTLLSRLLIETTKNAVATAVQRGIRFLVAKWKTISLTLDLLFLAFLAALFFSFPLDGEFVSASEVRFMTGMALLIGTQIFSIRLSIADIQRSRSAQRSKPSGPTDEMT